MSSERGSALILALMLLAFLMILGGALLMSVTQDVAIGDNYRSETQLLYVAESGIEEARELLSTTPRTPSQLLAAAAGADGVLSESRDLETLLNTTDDVPFLNGGERSEGKRMSDTSGRPAGRYFVFLRNDSGDGMTSLNDSNQILTLLSVAVIGNSRKIVETTVMKWKFPAVPAALVFNGSPLSFTPTISGFGIRGIDASARGGDKFALGALSAADRLGVLSSIPDSDEVLYPGSGVVSPPPADVGVIDNMLDPRLRTPDGIERIVDRIIALATDVYSPGWNGTTVLGNIGSASDYHVVVVNGDCQLASGTGYGVLLARGNLKMSGSFHWYGLILVIGQGTIGWTGAGVGEVSGGVFVSRTRADDRGPANPMGTVLAARGAVVVDLRGGGNGIQMNNPGSAAIDLAQQKFPYVPIATREY